MNRGVGKKIGFVWINGDNLLDSGDQVLDFVFKWSGLFHDTKDIGHVTTTCSTSPAGIYHVMYRPPVFPHVFSYSRKTHEKFFFR